MWRPPEAPRPVGTNAYGCSMPVEDFDGTAKAILKNGGPLAQAGRASSSISKAIRLGSFRCTQTRNRVYRGRPGVAEPWNFVWRERTKCRKIRSLRESTFARVPALRKSFGLSPGYK